MDAQQYQIQVAEQALLEMKFNLNNQKQSANAQSQSVSQGKPQPRPKSQNDASSYIPDSEQTGEYDKATDSNSHMQSQEQRQPDDPEIDKRQYLNIVQSAFQKITGSMHPAISNSLNQIRMMYDHLYAQLETNHQNEQAAAHAMLSQLQQHVCDLQSQGHDQAQMQEQMHQLLGQNKQYQAELGATQNELQQAAQSMQAMSQKLDVKEKQIGHLKQNIEDQRTMQNVIRNDLKIMNTNGVIAIDSNDMEPTASKPESSRMVEEAEENQDFFDIDVTIQPPTRADKFTNHVRINKGKIIEQAHSRQSRRRFDDASENLSSIPSYAGSGRRQTRNEQLSHEESNTQTIDSDMIVALDHAMNSGVPNPRIVQPIVPPISHKPVLSLSDLQQDKSPLKMPSLNFN